MNKMTHKLILSVSACAMTLVCLTSTTYAWFARNNDAWVDNFKLNIEQHDGLVISIDGVNYTTSIDNDSLFKAIASKRYNKEIVDVSDEDILNCKNSILEPVSTYDLKSFTTVNLNSKIEDGYYVPSEASNNSYLEFDLYFKIDQSKSDNSKNYYLTFANEENLDEANKPSYLTSIEGHSENIYLTNKLSTIEKEYYSGEYITVNSNDAIRVGVLKSDDEALIYEPSIGLGSYALKDESIDIYNPNKNAMLTYFNNTHIEKLKPLEDHFDVYKNTKKSFLGYDNLGVFKKNDSSYDSLKITVFIWLEGYDSDFIKGFDDSSLNCTLSFMKGELV